MGIPTNFSSETPASPPANESATRGRMPGLLPPRRGRLFQLLWPFTSYLVTNVTVTLFWVLFFVLNRTTVIGRRSIGEERNTLLLSNHQSMLDSFLVGLAAFFPQSWLRPHLLPWNPAAAENFYKSPVLAWLADNWKCIWVREGRRDLHALHRMMQVLPIRHYVPRIFKRISVSFGQPVDYTEFLKMPRTRETAQAVIDRVMEAIRSQHGELERRKT